MDKFEFPDPMAKRLAPSWCFAHGAAIPCLECDKPCHACGGYGKTINSDLAGMAGANPNCPACNGSGLAGKHGNLLLHPDSWLKIK